MATYLNPSGDISGQIQEGDILNFEYTGNIAAITVLPGTYKLEVWGAQGGTSLNDGVLTTPGGKGGYSVGTYTLTNNNFYICVGGKGTDGVVGQDSPGGYNGGGLGTWDNADNETSGAGGGATHIATATGLLQSLSSNRSAVLIVAGAGGGASWTFKAGAGGGTSGEAGNAGAAGTQTTGYAFGRGQDASGVGSSDGVGGGGSGWYGGYMCSTGGTSSGGGGSGYINPSLASAQTIIGTSSFPSITGGTETGHAGNGYARITIVSIAKPKLQVKYNGNIISSQILDTNRSITLSTISKYLNGDIEVSIVQ